MTYKPIVNSRYSTRGLCSWRVYLLVLLVVIGGWWFGMEESGDY